MIVGGMCVLFINVFYFFIQVQCLNGVGAVLQRRRSSPQFTEPFFRALKTPGGSLSGRTEYARPNLKLLYPFLGANLESRLMELLSSPFDDINIGAIGVATGLAVNHWGQKVCGV